MSTAASAVPMTLGCQFIMSSGYPHEVFCGDAASWSFEIDVCSAEGSEGYEVNVAFGYAMDRPVWDNGFVDTIRVGGDGKVAILGAGVLVANFSVS